jgi:Taurine catabolism dioxygenase TauD, TfdA family
MLAEKHHPIDAPYAWKGAEMQHSTEWLRPFTPDELAEIDAALQSVKARGLDLFDIERKDFPLRTFSNELANIAQELETGRGMIMLRGLPLAYTPDDLQIVYWGIGTHLGTAVSQNAAGELFGIVKDFGRKVENTKRRGSKTADELEFHSDRCDVVGLLCVRKAKSGGASRIVSSAAIHNEIVRRRPDLIDICYADWPQSWQGEEPAGHGRTFARPIFGFRDGYFTGLFSPAYARFAQEFPEVPRHTAAQREVLELYKQLADELALDMHFEPGDIQLLNNHLIYHGRTEFQDYPEEDRKRLLLRLWLSVPGSRPLPKSDGYELVLGSIEAGAVRGGVPCRDGGWRAVSEFRARRASAKSAAAANP